ncbi:MAG: ROK family transcriptional regulator [Pseudomonadota bacterium]
MFHALDAECYALDPSFRPYKRGIVSGKRTQGPMVAGTESLRHQNRALVLASLRSYGAMAHTDLSKKTGLSSATVSSITTDLLQEDVIRKSQTSPSSGRGRPRVLLAQNPSAAFMVALRITSEEFEFSLADYAGTLKDRFSLKRDIKQSDTSAFLDFILTGLDRLVDRSKLPREKVRAISISSKGVLDNEQRTLLWSPVLGNQRVGFEEALSAQWPARIVVTEETQFTAQAVIHRMLLANPDLSTQRVAALSLGHSIGLGVASKTAGSHTKAFAPPFGHMPHLPDGPLCRCGAQGCVEAYAGFYGILRTSFEAPDQTIPANFVPIAEMDKIAANARTGHLMAQFAFRRAGEVLGTAISRLFSLQGTMPLAITGPGLAYYDLMQESLIAAIKTNLIVRLQGLPDISLYPDQATLVFEGNVESVLSHLDETVLASGRNGS